nr:MAG TPA: hypothetical protein [Caudoviricetes sp.]
MKCIISKIFFSYAPKLLNCSHMISTNSILVFLSNFERSIARFMVSSLLALKTIQHNFPLKIQFLLLKRKLQIKRPYFLNRFKTGNTISSLSTCIFKHRLEIAGAIFMPFWRWCLCEN